MSTKFGPKDGAEPGLFRSFPALSIATMSDPITTILTTAIEHVTGTTAAVTLYKAAKPFLAKILGPGADELGEIGRDFIKGKRAKNAERTLADADKLLAETGREPQEVPLNIVVPLLEAASLQDDPTLADLWAALLANAADSAQQAPVQPGFTEVLRQLTPLDARVLAHIYKRAQVKEEYLLHYELEAVITQRMPSELGITDKQLALSVDTLLRLRLCAPPTRRWEKGEITGPSAATLQVCPTVFGVAFLAAVTPPTQ